MCIRDSYYTVRESTVVDLLYSHGVGNIYFMFTVLVNSVNVDNDLACVAPRDAKLAYHLLL